MFDRDLNTPLLLQQLLLINQQPRDIGRRLNEHKTFRRCPGLVLNHSMQRGMNQPLIPPPL